jgi:hypothetical protein
MGLYNSGDVDYYQYLAPLVLSANCTRGAKYW